MRALQLGLAVLLILPAFGFFGQAATQTYVPFVGIIIDRDSGNRFSLELAPCQGNPLVGVVRGCGTASDPYVIEKLDIGRRPGLHGIDVRSTTKHVLIRDVWVRNMNTGILIRDASNIRVENVLVENNGDGGIQAFSSTNIMIIDSVVRSNNGDDAVVISASDVVVRGNQIINNQFNGITVANRLSDRVFLRNNTIANNSGAGIYFFNVGIA
ncbi:MAG TPA: right-handed parallel beta-helix repeat-containing protein, partial [Candidatus Thermoplasmatota archaeon]|nr:right-handed parallel beta-helix repeat-containing protein [Candidatus Thermoplasmatota archaeon]